MNILSKLTTGNRSISSRSIMRSYPTFFTVISLILASTASAATHVIVDLGGSTGRHSLTRHDCGGLKPEDLSSVGAGEQEDYISACYSGHASEVQEILENLASCQKNWKLKSFELYRPVKDFPKYAKAIFKNKNSDWKIKMVIRTCN